MQCNLKSDICNFYGNLKKYSDSLTKPYSYMGGHWSDFEEWKSKTREKVFNLLSYYPREVPMDQAIIDVKDKGFYTQEEIMFNSAENVNVVGSVLIPKEGKAPFPAIIALHDHGGFYYYGREKIICQDNEPAVLTDYKKEHYGGRSWANELVGKGFIVLCIDGFFFGSRRTDISMASDEVLSMCPYKPDHFEPGTKEYIEEYNQFCWWFEGLLVKSIFSAGATWPGILFHDDRKSIDYLMTRKDVDKNRIGCCGLSLGGYRSVHLAALDPRIKCAVATGWMTTMASLLYDHLKHHTYMVYIPGLTRYLELPDLAGMVAPNKLFIQQCRQDPLFTLDGMSQSCEIIKEIYKRNGYSNHFKYEFYDNAHKFTIKMQEDAFEWLEMSLINENKS